MHYALFGPSAREPHDPLRLSGFSSHPVVRPSASPHGTNGVSTTVRSIAKGRFRPLIAIEKGAVNVRRPGGRPRIRDGRRAAGGAAKDQGPRGGRGPRPGARGVRGGGGAPGGPRLHPWPG